MKRTASSVGVIFLLLLNFVACKNATQKVDANDVAVTWQMGENNYQGKGGFISSFVLTNQGKKDMPHTGWNIYFNFVRLIKPESVTGNVSIKHINGDFYVLSPKENFRLAPNDSIRIDFVSGDWAISETDGPAGLYLVAEDENGKEGKPEVIRHYVIKPFTDKKQSQRSPDDLIPVTTASLLYEKYSSTSILNHDELQPVLPSPASYLKGKGTLALSSFTINAPQELVNEKEFLQQVLSEVLEKNSAAAKTINLKLGTVNINDKSLLQGSEAYALEVKPSGITITGADAQGVFYGIQSLRALMPADATAEKKNEIVLNEITITDYPRFHYRGIHLDVARNFQKKATILKMLDLMALYKLNKFHFHLSDDEGWRIEMKSLPELTTIGGKRGHDRSGKGMLPTYGSGPDADDENTYGFGYYTENDFIEILRYANERHIEVIPKIDMPGHARAAIKAMDTRYEKAEAEGKQEEASQYLLRDLNDSSVYRSVQLYNDNVICVCQESTYNFIRTVVGDFKSLYAKAGVTFNTFHIGADEVPHGAWEKSPRCNDLMKEKNLTIEEIPEYFYKRVSEILKAENLNMGGWEEIALKKTKTESGIMLEANPAFVKSNFRPYVWNSVWGWEQEDVGYKLANAGYPVVLGNVTNLYFDLAYEKHPEEPGYYWGAFVDTKKVFEFNPFDIYSKVTHDKMGNRLDPEKLSKKVRLTTAGRANIIGIQGQLWAENIKGQERLEYLAFPKLLALAERAWSGEPEWNNIKNEAAAIKSYQQSWNLFSNAMGTRELPRLDNLKEGVGYRISPPGALIKEGKLYANTEFPGLTIRYTTDGSQPTASSQVYNGPVAVTGSVVKLKCFSSKNRSSRTLDVPVTETVILR